MTKHWTDDRGHVWKLYEDGDIDIFGIEYDHHNGPVCIKCGYGFCHHCEDGPTEDCEANSDVLDFQGRPVEQVVAITPDKYKELCEKADKYDKLVRFLNSEADEGLWWLIDTYEGSSSND